jgi:hypothetical protein
MDVRNNLHKGLVHKRAARQPDLSTNNAVANRNVEKPHAPGSLAWRERDVAPSRSMLTSRLLAIGQIG